MIFTNNFNLSIQERDMNTSSPPAPQADPSPAASFVHDGGFLNLQAPNLPVPWKKRFRAAGKSLRKGTDVGVGILNGVVGDYLHQQGNPLAVRMGFYASGKPLSLTPEALASTCPNMTSRICVLIHGLVCDETIWNYGES